MAENEVRVMIDEIGKLTHTDMQMAEFYREVLGRLNTPLQAEGMAAWVCDGDNVELLAHKAWESEINVQVDLAPDLPLLRTDGGKLRQILLNLLSNAVKYNVKGGRVDIRTGCDRQGGMYLTVSDTGIGIAQSDIKKVMEPFGQARSDAYRTHGGTGLGLSLSKQLTELQGGTLVLTSELDVGATVTVVFPPERTVRDTIPTEIAFQEEHSTV